MLTALVNELDGHLQRGVERFVRWGLDAQTAISVLNRVARLPDGPSSDAAVEEWITAGSEFRDGAIRVAAAGQTGTADAWRRQAFWCYRAGDFSSTRSSASKLDAYARSIEMFELLTVGDSVTPVSIDVQGMGFRGMIVHPRRKRNEGLVPGVVLIYGADGNKEEHYWASAGALARRGVATIVVDGPGQGHAIRYDGIGARPDYEIVASAALTGCSRTKPSAPSASG
jgi:hypothetical protein